MAKLSEDQKEFIVEHLACYDTPQQVADAFKDEFELTIKRQQVEEYDPVKRKPAQKWVDLHAAIRKSFLEDLSNVPASKKSYRVRRLAAMAMRAEKSKNFVLAKDLYEQIAKEMGEAFTNRRVIVPANPLDELAKALGVTADQLAISLDLVDGSGMATDGAVAGDDGVPEASSS